MIDIVRNMPLVAILRGVQPQQVCAIGEILYEVGFRVVEVPLNSPNAYDSIGRLRSLLGSDAIVGAGTVLTAKQAEEVQLAGGQIIVSPNTNTEVIQKTKQLKMLSCPGVMTPSEAFTALQSGADLLKYFPCEALSARAIKAQRAVLPKHTFIVAVGGIDHNNMRDYYAAGINGFGFASAVFTPQLSISDISKRSNLLMGAWQQLLAEKT